MCTSHGSDVGYKFETERPEVGLGQEFSPVGTSLMVQWLRLCAPNAGGLGSIPGQGTRSHMPQLKIPRATTMTRVAK